MRLYYQKHLKSYSQKLRKVGNFSEVLLWDELKQDKLGYRFLRQRPIGEYIMDFYCHTLNLVIEIDGATSHNDKIEADETRQRTLESLGISVLRFTDSDVRYQREAVVQSIRSEILRLARLFTSFRKGGRIYFLIFKNEKTTIYRSFFFYC